MPTLNYARSVSGLGGSISKSVPRTADGGGNREVSVPMGFAGTLSTRTDDETGTLTLAAGHEITTGQVIDLYWDGGFRSAITVGTVSVNSVPIGADDSGEGNILPAQTTAIVASPRVSFNADIDVENLVLLTIQMYYASSTETSESNVTLSDEDSEVVSIELTSSQPRVWDVYGGDANPFYYTGVTPIATGVASNGSSATDAVLKILWLQDSTP